MHDVQKHGKETAGFINQGTFVEWTDVDKVMNILVSKKGYFLRRTQIMKMKIFFLQKSEATPRSQGHIAEDRNPWEAPPKKKPPTK